VPDLRNIDRSLSRSWLSPALDRVQVALAHLVNPLEQFVKRRRVVEAAAGRRVVPAGHEPRTSSVAAGIGSGSTAAGRRPTGGDVIAKAEENRTNRRGTGTWAVPDAQQPEVARRGSALVGPSSRTPGRARQVGLLCVGDVEPAVRNDATGVLRIKSLLVYR
jgi:hypothetical protein